MRIKYILAILWVGALIIAFINFQSAGISIQEYPGRIVAIFAKLGYQGPLLFIVFYAFRGLFFFPATILTIASGALFGPVYGSIYTFFGILLSSFLSFAIGRFFGGKFFQSRNLSSKQKVSSFHRKLLRNGKTSVLIMRLLFFPFDAVGYLSGAIGIKQRDFLIGTAFGTIPGLLAFTFLGGSTIDGHYLLVALCFFLVSIGLSSYLKKHSSLAQSINASQS